MHNLPRVLFVHSHVPGGGHSPTLKGYMPLSQPPGKGGGLPSLFWADPLPLLSSCKYWHPSSPFPVRSIGQVKVASPWLPHPGNWGATTSLPGPQRQFFNSTLTVVPRVPQSLLRPPGAQCPWADCDSPERASLTTRPSPLLATPPEPSAFPAPGPGGSGASPASVHLPQPGLQVPRPPPRALQYRLPDPGALTSYLK